MFLVKISNWYIENLMHSKFDVIYFIIFSKIILLDTDDLKYHYQHFIIKIYYSANYIT